MDMFFTIIGAVGLILITYGIVTKGRKLQDYLDILGGICLEIYSIHIGNVIFIVLQLVFTGTAIWDFFRKRKSR
ncbi:hypothetical protein H6503_01215 [Candidatus Woesearchaeota archaeon]|nr:hypothetical protein [Candidatus Woesearchaeota archaeon]